MIVKALSLHEPWASMIADGTKTIETRMWPTSYRGPLAIHATVLPKFPRSGEIVAVTYLHDCVPMTADHEKPACCKRDPGRFAWLLRCTVPLEAGHAVVGNRRLWNWNAEGYIETVIRDLVVAFEERKTP